MSVEERAECFKNFVGAIRRSIHYLASWFLAL